MARSETAFDTYLKEIRQYDLLTPEAEKALAIRIQNQDVDHIDAAIARDELIRSNLRLVVSVAKRYAGRGLPLADLVEEGNIGLVHAVEKFDPTMDTRFSTYGTWWIKQAIRRSLMNSVKTVRIPPYMAEELTRWRMFARKFEQDNGRAPENHELIEQMNPPPGRRKLLIRLFRTAAPGSASVSLDALFETVQAVVDPRAERPDMIDFAAWERQGLMDRIAQLPEREGRILRLRYGLDPGSPPLTLREIAAVMTISRERVRQLEHQAVRTLRRWMDGDR